ncbi:MAG TPA: RNA polymerase sigma factor [Candidatus Polarisedimenticolia bacterium]|nr:RNA polymerase sigma factor [Candidatus Polarisedimenticolia bacterium]
MTRTRLAHGPRAVDNEAGRTAELVRRAREGDERAFRDLMAAYRSAFYGLARRYAGSHADADDVLQDAFVKVFQNLGALTQPEAFFPWARRIIVNTALDHLRSRRRSLRHEVPPPERLAEERADLRLEAPDRRVERSEFLARLETAIRSLPPRQREIVILHDVEGLSTEEVALHCGCPPATVRSNLFYGREKLRALLGGHWQDEGPGPGSH